VNAARRAAKPTVPTRIASAGGARPRLGEQVAAQLLRLIQRGEFPLNCRLPTEAELALRFRVSRPVIREALAGLRDEGWIRSLQGSGSLVIRGPEAGGLAYPTIGTVGDLQRLFEFRLTVEAETAALAAERRAPAALAAIERALDDADLAIRAGTTGLGPDLNFAFHRAVARATGNAFFVATLEAIPNLVGEGRIAVRNFGHDDPIARLRATAEEHRSILDAIRDRDPARARATMIRHIDRARDEVFERQQLA
jgi:DNA-binding FadR family transcriptional regulator